MSDVFTDAANAVVSGQPSEAAPSQSENQQDLSPSTESNLQSASDGAPKGDVAMAIAELDKMDKFKLDGQEWTLKDLKAAIMRQKDYTQKTQTLAEERKSFQEERKFHENLAWDLQKVRENPELAKEFVRVYPQGFHKHVAEFLKTSNSQSSPQPQVQQPQVDVQLLSRLQTLENYYHQQEVSRQQTEIEKMAGELAKEYPDAGNAMKMVYAMAYEAQLEAKNNGRDLTRDDWESIFKSVDTDVKEMLKANYGNLVKKQTDANAKARDVGSGGGTAGRAPVKFKNFDQLQKHAEELSRGGG